MGVVSGIVLSYQFGTNWSRFSAVVGNIVGPLIGYEVLTAFFLEATFLGIMLFGWNAGAAVAARAVGDPGGARHADLGLLDPLGQFVDAVSRRLRDAERHRLSGRLARRRSSTRPFRWRLVHMVTAAYLTTAFVVLAVGARYFLAGKHPDHARTMLKMGIAMAAVLAPAQLFFGDQHGLEVAEYQPAKLAAIEAHWQDDGPVPLRALRRPQCGQASATISKSPSRDVGEPASSPIRSTARFQGLKDFPAADRPPVDMPFFAFRIMVGIGFAMIGLALWGAWLWWRGRLDDSTLFMRLASWSWPAGFIAVLSGWVVAEVGRQPWVVTGVLRTSRGVLAGRRASGGGHARPLPARLRRRVRRRHRLHEPADQPRPGGR